MSINDVPDFLILQMAMACLHIHSELILQASRSIEIQHKKNGADITYKLQNINITSIPYTHAK